MNKISIWFVRGKSDVQVEIYGDLFFLVTFVMDFIIFWACAKILKRKIRLLKIFFFFLLTTILNCIAVFNLCFSNLIALLILILGIVFVFKPNNFFDMAKIIFFINVIGFLIGGMTTSLFYFFDANKIFFGLENFSFKVLFVSSAIFFIFIKLFAEYIKKIVLSKEVYYEINIFIGEQKFCFQALVDTGNCLFDDLTGLPIVIVELDKIKNIFSQDILQAIKNKNFEMLCLCKKIKFNFVSFKSIGNKNGLLICFHPDQIKILCGEKIILANALIGICDFKISRNYCGLINPSLIK